MIAVSRASLKASEQSSRAYRYRDKNSRFLPTMHLEFFFIMPSLRWIFFYHSALLAHSFSIPAGTTTRHQNLAWVRWYCLRKFVEVSSLVSLFQNESEFETFHMKMSCTCKFIFMQIKVIFIRMVSHLDPLWNRDTRELGNGLFVSLWSISLRYFFVDWQRILF